MGEHSSPTDYRLQSSPYLSMAGLSITEQPQLDQGCTKGRFQGHVAIVTGGAGGIGGMIVQRFLNDGASVAILDMNEERGQQIIVELKTIGLDTKVKLMFHLVLPVLPLLTRLWLILEKCTTSSTVLHTLDHRAWRPQSLTGRRQ